MQNESVIGAGYQQPRLRSSTNFKLRFSSLSVSTDGLRLPLLQTHSAIASSIDFYSPSLRRLSVSFDGLRLPLIQIYIAENSLLF